MMNEIDEMPRVKEALLRARQYLLDRQDVDTRFDDEIAACLIKELVERGTVDYFVWPDRGGQW